MRDHTVYDVGKIWTERADVVGKCLKADWQRRVHVLTARRAFLERFR
jgi:hypothetical protein